MLCLRPAAFKSISFYLPLNFRIDILENIVIKRRPCVRQKLCESRCFAGKGVCNRV